jgi:hypothetical protein
VLSLGGRPVLRSATPWLWSHGYEFRQRESDVRRIYAGTVDAAELLRFYHVDYVYLGDAERSDVKANDAFFDANLPAIYHSQTITIYDARKLRDPSTEGPSPVSQRDIASRLDSRSICNARWFRRHQLLRLSALQSQLWPQCRVAKEFMSAMRLLGRDLVYGSSLWETQLHRNRAALLKEWTMLPGVQATL